jgi:hypothetical protein
MTKAIYIIGPESSGNRLMLRLMLAAGCRGELRDDNSQPFDNGFPSDNGEPIAYLRTVPHAQKVHDPKDDILKLRKLGYDVMAIVMVRDWYPMCRSQVTTKHVTTLFEAEQRSMGALGLIFHALHVSNTPFVVVTYSGLVNRPVAMGHWLFGYLGFPLPIEIEAIHNADHKWWAQYLEAVGMA